MDKITFRQALILATLKYRLRPMTIYELKQEPGLADVELEDLEKTCETLVNGEALKTGREIGTTCYKITYAGKELLHNYHRQAPEQRK